MLDSKLLRNELDHVVANLARRGYDFPGEAFESLEATRKEAQVDTERLRSERNQRSKSIGAAKARGEDIKPLLAEVDDLGERLKVAEATLHEVQGQLEHLLKSVPNLLADDVPEGRDESANVEVRRDGEPPAFDFEPRDHVDIGASLGGLDFDAAARMTGSRFAVMSGQVAYLHRALGQFMLDIHTQEHGYREVNPPVLVAERSLVGTGQLPKFKEDLYSIATHHGEDDGAEDYYLVPTAEVPLTNLVRDSVLDADALPLRLAAHTLCFRAEAGSYGRDTRGMIRQHQFEKVELVQVVPPQESDAALEALTGHAEEVLRRLGLPYRVVKLCAGDTGFSARRTYDLEVWLPGQGQYREISSCSSFDAFQARRMGARWRNPETGKPEPVHTINGSGLAIGRTLIAVLENYQRADGTVEVPAALRPYMGGLTQLGE